MKKRSYFLTAFLLFAGIFNTWAYDGDGSAATPYQIKTVEDLKTLATEVNGGNAYSGKFFELTTDLDLEEAEWTRIGNDKKLFSGTFDGKGHSISNFKISESSTATDGTQNGVGLFGGLGGPLKNLIIKGANVTNKQQNVAVLAGTITADAKIENCVVMNSTLTMDGGSGRFGFIIGKNWNNKIIVNCFVVNSTLTIKEGIQATGAGLFIGAAAGGQGTTFTTCYTSGCTINAPNATESQKATTGVFMGMHNNDAHPVTFDNCFAQNIDGFSFVGKYIIDKQTYKKAGVAVTIAKLEDLNDQFYLNATTFTDGTVVGYLNAYKQNEVTWKQGEKFPIFSTMKDPEVAQPNGSETDPYLITSVDDLKQLATEVNGGESYAGKFFELTTDLDLNNEEWTSIGNNSKTFNGVFNGKGHVISNLEITVSSEANDATINGRGLFGGISKGTIKNLGIANANVTNNKQNIAVLVGVVSGTYSGSAQTAIDDKVAGIVENCYVINSTLTMDGKADNSELGATEQYGLLIGRTFNAIVKNCFVANSTLTITENSKEITAPKAGILVGAPSGGAGYTTFSNCFTAGCSLVSSDDQQLTSMGAFYGLQANTGHVVTFEDCYAQEIEGFSFVGAVNSNQKYKKGTETLAIAELSDLNDKLYLDATAFTKGEVAWALNQNKQNGVAWSQGENYPIVADAENAPVYKANMAIHNGEQIESITYTKGNEPLDAITINDNAATAIVITKGGDLATETINALITKYSNANTLKYMPEESAIAGKNVIKDGQGELEVSDNLPFFCPMTFTATAATYKRTFNAGWNTVYLPFASVKPDGTELEIIESCDGTDAKFKKADAIAANTPYNINIETAGEKTFTIGENKVIPTSTDVNDQTVNGYTVKGCFIPTMPTAEKTYIMSTEGEKEAFNVVEEDTELTPFRAYLEGPANAAAKINIIHYQQNPDNITEQNTIDGLTVISAEGAIKVIAGKAQTAKLFGIDGRLVKVIELIEGENTITGITGGIYILNNEKVIVK